MSNKISFRNASVDDALFIARGFHMAMLYDDASEEQISNFARNICVREDVLYSWCNTIIAEVDGKCAGMLTAYDGRYYHDMRIRTMSLVKQHLGVEFPGMEDEAVAGEYYLDSLAVMHEYRGRGIGRRLLKQGIENGKALSLDVTLAVDPINDRAKKLYQSLGFKPSGTLFIFGHDYEKMIVTAKQSAEPPVLNSHNKEEHRPSHTAEHLLNQTMVRMFGCERSKNAHIERKKSKINYNLPVCPAAEQVAEIERRMNELIEMDLPVTYEFATRDNIPDGVKLDKLPEDASETLRLVRIGDYDICPCIGQHVESTKKIGEFKITSTSFADGSFRIVFKVNSEKL